MCCHRSTRRPRTRSRSRAKTPCPCRRRRRRYTARHRAFSALDRSDSLAELTGKTLGITTTKEGTMLETLKTAGANPLSPAQGQTRRRKVCNATPTLLGVVAITIVTTLLPPDTAAAASKLALEAVDDY